MMPDARDYSRRDTLWGRIIRKNTKYANRQFLRIIMKNKRIGFYWLIMPIVHCMLLSAGYYAVNVLMKSQRGNWGALLYALLFIAFYSIVISPILSIIYCKKLYLMSWGKYLCCFYNATMMGMYYTLCIFPADIKGFISSVMSIPWISMFLSSLVSGLITLIIHDVKKQKMIVV